MDNFVDKENFWTLAKISLKEVLDIGLQERIQDYRPYKHPQSRKFSFRANIQSASPILTLDPSDPFGLLQVEDEGYCSVLVLQKEALAYCTLLTPGSRCFFQNVTRIAWKVPEEIMSKERFAHLKSHIPTHVFIIHRKHQILLLDDSRGRELPLSISGSIVNVHTVKRDDSVTGNSLIQYVDLLVLANKANCRLYLEHFPMSTTTQLSLRSGATIMATNIHDLGQGHFALCLRSSLHVHRMQSADLLHVSNKSKIDVESTTPFAYVRIRKSCFETALSTLFAEFLEGFGFQEKPSARQWTRSWLRHHGVVCSSSHGTKPPKRNVYAEFFDHHQDVTVVDEKIERCGCHLSRLEAKAPTLPFMLGLSDIQNEVINVLQARLNEYIANNGVRAGWTASFSLVSEELNDGLLDRKSTDKNIFSGGVIVSAAGPFETQDCSTSLLAVSNGHTVLPVAVKDKAAISKHAHVLFQVESVTTSILCLGTFPKRNDCRGSDNGTDVCILPMLGADSRFRGPCALLRLAKENWIFIISFHIQATALLNLSPEVSPMSGLEELVRSSVLTSLAAVAQPTFDAPVCAPVSKCISLLVRKQFAFTRLKNGRYGGITLTLAHMPSRNEAKGDLGDHSNLDSSSVQSIDCRPSLELEEDARRQMEAFFSCSSISASGVLGEHVATALAFWKIASCETHCSLLSGGWDELCSGACTYSLDRKVAVFVPLNAFQRDPKRGYLRLRCTLDDIVAFPLTSAKRSTSRTNTKSALDFVGGRKMISGMLDRRPNRKQYGDVAVGERTATILAQADDGVPSCSIKELHQNICLDIQYGTCIHTAPSLTRRVVGGTFLGVSFCRAIAECSECYSPLVLKATNKSKIKQPTSHAVRKINILNGQQGYWNCPLPPDTMSTESTNYETQTTEKTHETDTAGVSPSNQSNDPRSTLICPKLCGGLTAIKWECSGTLDDSTGQAKLYAERDAALLLLGLSKEFASMIEEGAWVQPNGVVFSRSMAPNSSIAYAVSRAKYEAAEKKRGYKIGERDVLEHMEPAVRAEYLLQRHCRFSPEPSRNLNYYVRCKPIGDNSLHLKHTVVDLVSGKSVPTYTLPPLKLVLVDCHAVSSLGRQHDNG